MSNISTTWLIDILNLNSGNIHLNLNHSPLQIRLWSKSKYIWVGDFLLLVSGAYTKSSYLYRCRMIFGQFIHKISGGQTWFDNIFHDNDMTIRDIDVKPWYFIDISFGFHTLVRFQFTKDISNGISICWIKFDANIKLPFKTGIK